MNKDNINLRVFKRVWPLLLAAVMVLFLCGIWFNHEMNVRDAAERTVIADMKTTTEIADYGDHNGIPTSLDVSKLTAQNMYDVGIGTSSGSDYAVVGNVTNNANTAFKGILMFYGTQDKTKYCYDIVNIPAYSTRKVNAITCNYTQNDVSDDFTLSTQPVVLETAQSQYKDFVKADADTNYLEYHTSNPASLSE